MASLATDDNNNNNNNNSDNNNNNNATTTNMTEQSEGNDTNDVGKNPPPVSVIVLGMAGSGKTTLMQRINAHIHEYKLEKSEVYNCLSGEWEIDCEGQKIMIKEKDTFSVPKNSLRSIKQVSDEDGSLFIIRQTN